MYPCERHNTLSALCGCAMCAYAPHVCVHTIQTCVNTCFSKGRAVCIDIDGETMEQNFYQRRTCELVQAAVQKQNPRRQAKHRGLSQVYYICQQRSFITAGQRSHSFPLNAASSGTCECVRQILSHQPTHCPPDYLKLYSVSVSKGGLSAVTSHPHGPTDPLSIILCLIITADRLSLCIPKERRRGRRV